MADYVQGDAGRDAFWVDRNGATSDRVIDANADDKVQNVTSFLNGADRTLNGDRIADPAVKAGQTYKTFSNNPLFSSAGPSINDVRQGALGDCYLLAGVGSIALDSPHVLRQNVVDFDDGTYGVRLGGAFYRVDNDLPVHSVNSTSPAYAALGAGNSMWVAVVEKAFAHYRTGGNSYSSIEGGWNDEANRAFGSQSAGSNLISSYRSATNMANDIFNRWSTNQSVGIGFFGSSKAPAAGDPFVLGHAYSVVSVQRNASGVVTSLVLRNPWGVDGAGNDSNVNDGLITVTPAQIFRYGGRVTYGRV